MYPHTHWPLGYSHSHHRQVADQSYCDLSCMSWTTLLVTCSVTSVTLIVKVLARSIKCDIWRLVRLCKNRNSGDRLVIFNPDWNLTKLPKFLQVLDYHSQVNVSSWFSTSSQKYVLYLSCRIHVFIKFSWATSALFSLVYVRWNSCNSHKTCLKKLYKSHMKVM